MRNSDLLARILGGLTLLSSLWNLFMSGLWFLGFVLLLVGVLWLVPMGLAVLQLVLAVLNLVVGYNKGVIASPLIGMFVSLCNFNVFGFGLELVNLGLAVGSMMSRTAEDKALAAA